MQLTVYFSIEIAGFFLDYLIDMDSLILCLPRIKYLLIDSLTPNTARFLGVDLFPLLATFAWNLQFLAIVLQCVSAYLTI